MDRSRRDAFNAAYSDALFGRYKHLLESRFGEFTFRLAETPLFLTKELRLALRDAATEIVAQLALPQNLEVMRKVVPARYDVPGCDPLPNCVQVDFALCDTADGGLEPKLIELQGFPSLYALESAVSDAWAETISPLPGLSGDWTCFYEPRARAMALMRDTIVGDCDPEEVVMVDYEPEQQKTWPDFVATKKMFGVSALCVTKIKKDGKRLYREEGGKRIPIKRIYNRMVFDELETKNVHVPFSWNEELDVSWCSHPNWYWIWSKYSLPFLSHRAVPKATLLSNLERLPDDLSQYVLKPLFSFAGAGVVIDVTREAVDRVPKEQRDGWVLQEKIEYGPAIKAVDGGSVKAEVRVMLLRPPHEGTLVPLICLVRLSRGRLMGVDFNKGQTWIGGSVGMWTP